MFEFDDYTYRNEHEYATFPCPNCGWECCWNCSVKSNNDSTGEGEFTCPRCRVVGKYENGRVTLT
jgi:predicted RNA-binding Zn-ribbon protein involved in translation (DUF1610 family)